MSIRILPAIQHVALTILFVTTSALAGAQPKDGLMSGNIKYSSGQRIQPIFEGWRKPSTVAISCGSVI
jgi:hypothetical protein